MKKYALVIGGCSLDITYEEIENGKFKTKPSRSTPGGKGANQAVAIARAGQNVKMLSRLSGKDTENTEIILNNLKDNGVDTSLIVIDENIGNDISEVYVSKNGDNDIVRHNDAINSFTTKMIETNEETIKNAEYVIIQMKAPKDFTLKLVDFCFKNNVKVVLTPCPADKLNIKNEEDKNLIDKVTFITCNESECLKIFGEVPEKVVIKYPNKLIVTLGGRGLIYFDGKQIINIPAIFVENVVDTTGAGDTLCGNFVASLMSGKSIKESLIRGTFASSLKVQKESAQLGMPTKKQLDSYIKKYAPLEIKK